MTTAPDPYFLKLNGYGFRPYQHSKDEIPVCKLCWRNALPGGRPFPLIPEAGSVSFGRIVTGPYAEYASHYFYVVDELTSGRLIAYFTGADGQAVKAGKREVPWMQWRDKTASHIAEKEFGEISLKLYLPENGYLEGQKFLYTLSLGTRALQFLLHAKFNNAREMPEAPVCPEFHFHVADGHRGQGIGGRLIEHFLQQFSGKRYKLVCAQVTLCDGYKTLAYYRNMSYRGKKLWTVYDKRETAMYMATEKKAWGLGPTVENASLVANRKRLLAFLGSRSRSA